MTPPPRLLSIAGSDPSGGAGAQADLKTFSAFGCYGMAAITALTVQNTRGVTASYPVAPEIVAAQIDAILSDLAPDAVKIGMVATPEIARAIAQTLKARRIRNIVLDPVLVPTQGVSLGSEGLEAALLSELTPLAQIVTPNLHEAAALTATAPATGVEEMAAHDGEVRLFRGRRIATRHTHGTGCALSSAIAAVLATGEPLVNAVSAAKTWLERALEAADALDLGDGRGPPHHFHALWKAHS